MTGAAGVAGVVVVVDVEVAVVADALAPAVARWSGQEGLVGSGGGAALSGLFCQAPSIPVPHKSAPAPSIPCVLAAGYGVVVVAVAAAYAVVA